MNGIRGGDIASRITRGDGRRDIAIRGQHRTRYVHAPGFAVGIDRGLVGFGTDFNGNHITRFDVVINFTRHRNGLAGLGSIDHVIAGDIVDSNGSSWRDGIDAISVASIGSSGITRGITRGDAGGDIAVHGQHRSRNVHAPGLAIGIDGRLVRFRADFNRDGVTRFHFIAHLTGDRNRLTGLGRIDHVITGDIIDSNRRHWRNRTHAVSVRSIGSRDVACGITCGDSRTHITIGCQHGSRNIHAPGFTIGIHRRLVRFRANGNGDRIARFDVVIDLTGHRNRLTRFGRVNHVIAGDIIN